MDDNGELRDLEAGLTEMGRSISYPAIPNPAPAVVARFEALLRVPASPLLGLAKTLARRRPRGVHPRRSIGCRIRHLWR